MDLESTAVFAHSIGRFETAARLFGAAASDSPSELLPQRASFERAESSARRQLGPETFTIEWERGRRLRNEQIMEEVDRLLADDALPVTPQRPANVLASPLSPREVEVLLLLAEGL